MVYDINNNEKEVLRKMFAAGQIKILNKRCQGLRLNSTESAVYYKVIKPRLKATMILNAMAQHLIFEVLPRGRHVKK